MRNRANTQPRSELDFINGGTANASNSKVEVTKQSKAKPVSISFAEDNLKAIDGYIKNEMVNGDTRVNRSDVVRAGLLALESFSPAEISRLIQKAKLQ